MKEKKKKAEIEKMITRKNEIVEFIATKIVTNIGTGAHILLPKELVGKLVRVVYMKEISQ